MLLVTEYVVPAWLNTVWAVFTANFLHYSTGFDTVDENQSAFCAI
jgi:hypothetical protein